ncbi:type II toxin-antitoxin system RelE/ParE family toxin, partial [Vibrio cholerae]|nr:type II toxin-antitoxin system RelE/ParE family toxin [Vibrio cholerae]
TEPALSDLNDIAEYIALENVVAAKQLVQTVFTKVERLADFPESGRVLPELEHLNYREVVVNPCRVFYKYDDAKVRILFVMRAERDLRRLMLTKQ